MGCDTEVEREQIDKYEFNTADKRIAVYPSPEPDSPIVYINTFEGEGDNVYRALENMDNPAFTLVAVSGLKWEHDMAPWDIPPLSKKSTPCIGGADDYLQLLREEIMPRAEKMADGVSWRGLAGYSLAGLFTVYSLYRTDLFSRIASVSGSLWFPGLMDYITSHEMKKGFRTAFYFSLGESGEKDKKALSENSTGKLPKESGVSMQATVLIRSFSSIRAIILKMLTREQQQAFRGF